MKKVLEKLLVYPLPHGVGWPQVLGSLLMTSFAVQVVTGALLALYYSPSASEAWESVRYVEEEVRAGSLIRGVHHFGSSSFVVLLVLHAVRTFVWGAYKGERRWTWVVGCALFACVLGFGFTGYLLPWDLKAFFGTRVGVEIAGSVPLVGGALERLLAGGPSVGELTLPRFYAVHAVILPLVTAGLIGLHLLLVRSHGITPLWSRPEGMSGRWFHPHQLAKDSVVWLLLVLGLLGLASTFGAPLGERADPQNTTFVPHPEWYFLGLQQLLRVFQGDLEILGSFVIPSVAGAVFVLLPWIDRNPERDPRRRPVAMGVCALTILVSVGFTLWGAAELAAEEEEMARRIEAEAEANETDDPAAQDDSVEVPPPDEEERVERGALLYRELSCDACHAPANRGFDTPGLEAEGLRVQRDWLRAYMLEPDRIRFQGEGIHPIARMPDFQLEAEENEALVAYMMTLRDSFAIPERGLDAAAPPEEVEQGRVLFQEYDCHACHVLGGEGEDVGPRLDAAGARLTLDYMVAILLDPEGVVPGTSMTDYFLDEDEAVAMARFLQTMDGR